MRQVLNSFAFLLIFTLSVVFLLPGCKKESVQEVDYITDQDGHRIPIVKIGNQWWMAEDLRVRTYRNGGAIQRIQNDTATWNNVNAGGYYELDSLTFLYNWYAVHNPQWLAPAGWHVATDADWKELEGFLGMSGDQVNNVNWRGTNQGDKLKVEGIENWEFHEGVWATNESGFSAFAKNCIMFDSRPSNPLGTGYMGFWWTGDELNDTNRAWFRYLDYQKSGIFRYHGIKTYGFGVRCVRDAE